jgi:hypothetical protein
MKRIILSILAVAAAGSFAAAQTTASTGVSTTQAVSNTISVDKTSATLVLGTGNTAVLSYSSNDGATHAITVAASAWAGGPTGGTVFPKLSANANELRSSANAAPTIAPTLVTAAANTSSTLNVSLLAENVSGAGLQAGTYTSTVTYTLN